MNTSPTASDPRAEEQAALWAARLDGSVLTAEQRMALDQWLAEKPAHRALLSHYCQFSADLEQQLPLIAGIKELSAEVTHNTMTAQPHPWLRRPLMVGAALTAAAAVVLGFWLHRPAPPPPANFSTPVAQRQSLTLADGSRVELNARTNLQVTVGPHERHVRLVEGEAFFTVQKDPGRPFIVETPAGSVRVTGTQFDVRAEAETTLDVTVAEGTVQVRPGSTDLAPEILGTGERLSASAGTVSRQKLSAAALDNLLAWRQGQAVFAATPLREALARFARYHGRGISAAPDAAELRLGGRFSLDDLDGFYGALEEVLPVTVKHNLNGTTQVELRPVP